MVASIFGTYRHKLTDSVGLLTDGGATLDADAITR